jgi:L-lactate dehydrogenase complex protein LldF
VTGAHPLAGTTLRQRSAAAVADPRLRAKTAAGVDRFAGHRTVALATLDDPDGLRAAARALRARTLASLPDLLEQFADRVLALGGHVCWARDAAEANAYIASLARARGARVVVKSKSMATEETGLNDALEGAGARVVETDLGEWIIQLARETPSHIIAPALHRDRHDVADLFEVVAGGERPDSAPEVLAAFARERLRAEFLRADMGISGVNVGVASSGSIVLVTNEGNARLVTSVPPVHVAVMGMERLVPDWEQLDLVLNLLARSATGQHLSSYTSVITGPRRAGEPDGPEELHVVILDNGRSDILGGEFHEMLACIRCGACLNVCPVYRQIGGHAYGWVYSGPMGAVLTPLLAARHPEAGELAWASTLCGACMDACPVGIPLQDLLLGLRRRRAASPAGASTPGARARRSGERAAWKAWAAAWRRPATYRASTRAIAAAGARGAGRLPLWPGRDTPVPARRTFRQRWEAGEV